MVVLMLECPRDSMMKDNDTFSLFFSLVTKEFLAV